ncbi:MAG: hypothetical protein IH993_01020, partial [Proteobacteria bacterium]|nr:hypothetical protein [Pseudomonadota bacterium]
VGISHHFLAVVAALGTSVIPGDGQAPPRAQQGLVHDIYDPGHYDDESLFRAVPIWL